MDQCDQKSLEDKETDAFLDEVHKKKVSDEIRQRNREKKLSLPIPPEEKRPQVLDSVTQPCNSATSETSAINAPPVDKKLLDSKCKKGKLKQELFVSEATVFLGETNVKQNHVTKISGPGKSSIEEASQHLAQLCDKAIDAEDGANRANQEDLWKGFQSSTWYQKNYPLVINFDELPGKFKDDLIKSKQLQYIIILVTKSSNANDVNESISNFKFIN